MSTWIFLGVLSLATFVVLGFYGLSISGWKPPAPRTDLATPGHFVRMRGADNEIDLGRGWRSTDDPDAAWHLWWIPSTTEIVGLRTSEFPPPPGPFYMGPVHGKSPLDPMGVHHFTGMRILGYCDARPSKTRCDELRLLADGLDQFTGGTHSASDITN